MPKARFKHKLSKTTKHSLAHMNHFSGRHGVKIGLPRNSGRYPDGTYVLDVGLWHEFGIPGMYPERSWLRAGIQENLRKYRTFIRKALRKILLGTLKPSAAMKHLGIEAQNDVQTKIRDLSTPPNAPSTIAAKGFDNPLIHEGILRQAVTWVLLKRASRGA